MLNFENSISKRELKYDRLIADYYRTVDKNISNQLLGSS